MTKRPISLPKFGAQLRALRGALSRGKVCAALRRYGLTVDRSTLLHYERGAVTSPDPAVLWALARVYHTPIDELLTLLTRERAGRPLPNVKLGGGGWDLRQVDVAEWFGQLPPGEVQETLYALMRLVASNPAMSARSITARLPGRRRRRA